jgi:hypothetical protein
MRLDEIAPDLLLEMAYTRKRAEGIITGLEYQTNLHLLKLAAIPMPDQFAHWRHEVATWLSTIAAIRLKPSNRPGPSKFYFTILFEEPFGGNEVPGVEARLQLLRQQYGELAPDIAPEALVEKLRSFHIAFADGCSKGTMNLGVINSLISAF